MDADEPLPRPHLCAARNVDKEIDADSANCKSLHKKAIVRAASYHLGKAQSTHLHSVAIIRRHHRYPLRKKTVFSSGHVLILWYTPDISHSASPNFRQPAVTAMIRAIWGTSGRNLF